MSYLYRHIRLDTNQVFYIGIGSDIKGQKRYSRAHNDTQRSDYWKRVVAKADYEVEIMIDGLSRQEALEKEKEFIKLYGRKDLGLGELVNLTDGGDGGQGWIPPDEVRQKMREASARRNLTPELRAKFATGKGRIKSEEERAKLSAAHKGKIFSEEHKKNLSIAKMGLKPSEETRKKLSEIRKGRVCTDEARANISAALKGKKRTPEQNKNNALINYKLTREQVSEVIRLTALGWPCYKIGEIVGASKSVVNNIQLGKSYKLFSDAV